MFERIMVPLNGLASAEAAVAPAAAMARTHGAELHLVLVDGPSRLDPMSDEFFRVDCAAYRDGQMQPLADNLRHDLGIAVTTAMLAGPVVATLAHYASAVHADLIVMATHGRVGWRRAWVGSVADDLMHEVTIPLLRAKVRQYRGRSVGFWFPWTGRMRRRLPSTRRAPSLVRASRLSSWSGW